MEQLVYVCEICQTIVEQRNCCAVCPNCGREFDATDLPVMPANVQIRGEHSVRVPISDPRDFLPKSDERDTESVAGEPQK
ncbi:MAG TPA: hypothetical protein VGP72_14445 [Planctomycetota bacterium]|jgi:hypothetical protein